MWERLEAKMVDLERLVAALICKNCGHDRFEHDLETNQCLFGPTFYEPVGVDDDNGKGMGSAEGPG